MIDKPENTMRFGPAGLADSFAAGGYKKNTQIPAYAASFGLDAFEYQAGRGVRLRKENGEEMAAEAKKYGLVFSIHAPYYINLSTEDADKREATIQYLLQSAAAVRSLGGTRVIFHPGAGGNEKNKREEALSRALFTLQQVQQRLDNEGSSEIHLCPEVMGKLGQLGTLQEIITLCGVDKRITPCVDFGHLNARTGGSLKTKGDFAAAVHALQDGLGDDRGRFFHVHFSKIQYTAGGEKCHLTFADTQFGPDWEPFVDLCAEENLYPTVICESAGMQTEDAAQMALRYRALYAAKTPAANKAVKAK